MSEDTVQVANNHGGLLDARVSVQMHDGDAASITFESQGGGRNKDYIVAHNLIIARLASLSATLLDAIVVSADTKNLDEAKRRFCMGDKPYPCQLTPETDSGKRHPKAVLTLRI